MSQVVYEGPDGRPVAGKADAEGRPLVSADIGVDAGTGVPLGSETWMPVAIVQQANPLQVETVNNPTAAATPGAGDEGIVVRSPMEPDITAIRNNTGNTVIELQTIQTQLAAVGTEVTLQQVRDAVIALGAGFTLADLYGALTPLATEATLATRASEATVLQIEDEVDGLEAGQAAANAELNAINAGIPTALGQGTMAQSMPVVVASDQSPVPIKQAPGNRRPNGLPSTHTAPVVVVTGAVKLRSLYAKIAGAGTRYLWVFDGAATGDAIAANAVPPPLELSVVLGLAWQTWPELGLPMSNGIVLALSSTQDTYTFSADSWTLEQVTWET